MNYIIYGNSYKLIDREIDKIVKDKDKTSYFMGESSIEDILSDISYNSLFEDEKTIIIRRAELIFSDKESKKDNLSKLLNFLKDDNKKITMILISNSEIKDRTKLGKEVLSYFKVIETPSPVKSYEVAKLFMQIVSSEGYGISTNDANLFCTKCLNNIDIAINELDKLKLIKEKNTLITHKDLDLVSNYNLNDMFGFKDAVINKDYTKALDMLDDLKFAKVNALPLVIMLGKEYQTLYDIKYLSSLRYTNERISREMDNMNPYRVKILREESNKYKIEELEDAILKLSNIALKLVSQDNLGLGEITNFLIEL